MWDRAGRQWSRPPAFEDGAAGLVSTADDLLAFARMFLRDEAHGAVARGGDGDDPRPVDAAHSERDRRRSSATRSWGLCQSVVISGERAGAFGWDGGLGSSFLVDPLRDVVVIVLTQRVWDSPQPPAVHTDLQDAAYAALR